MKLTADMIYGFSSTVLSARYDSPKPTPAFHIEMWEYCCSDARQVAIAAPRGHAKSTAVTHAFTLACMLFKVTDYGIIVSDTEGQAVQFLHDIKVELLENEELRQLFGVKSLDKDTESDIIVSMENGDKFRLVAKGSEQKVRGLKWRGRRPNLIIGDDLENDEIVMNEDRREKFRRWFYGALLPCLSDDGIIRVVGTVLHLDSMLERLMPQETHKMTVRDGLRTYSTVKHPAWKSIKFKAHTPDFKQILWPEKFDKKRLMAIRDDYVTQGMPEGYSQEYLNVPLDEASAYFKKSDMLPIKDNSEPLEYYAAADLAISERERAAFTAMVVAGVNASGVLKVVDVYRARIDSLEIVEQMLAIQQRYRPNVFTVEDEKIKKAIGPFLNMEMLKRGIFINLNPVIPNKDKLTRARSIQARMRAGGVQFDKEAHWYAALEYEMTTFPRSTYSDQVDALAWLGLTLDKIHDADKEYIEELWEDEEDDYEDEPLGVSLICGY